MYKNNKILKYHKPFHINVGVVIFGVIFLYLIINIVIFVFKEKIQYYEVTEGHLESTSKTYNALAIRDEKVFYSDSDGYVNFYIPSSSRVSLNTLLYSISSSKNSLLNINKETESLTESNTQQILNYLKNFSGNYDNMDFYKVYDCKLNMESSIVGFINTNYLSKINSSVEKSSNNISIKKPKLTGTVEYYIDGYENKDMSSLSSNDFDKIKYERKTISSNSEIKKNDPIYKVINSETWSLLIKMDSDDIEKYSEKKSVRIKFLKDNISCNASIKYVTLSDGYYLQLTFSRYMNKFSSQRYIEIQLIPDYTSGLKIPKNSVVEKQFYTIPKEYASRNEINGKISFTIKETNSDKDTTKVIYPIVYGIKENMYLINTDGFTGSEQIISNDSKNKYTLGNIMNLKGVYIINSGYTQFREINVLCESNDYYIVEPGNKYGLTIYDHIVLNPKADGVVENQILYE